jgi:hypothetical protein
MTTKLRYGLSPSLWCACADYIESGDAHQLLRAAVNAPPLNDIVPAAEVVVLPLPGASADEQIRDQGTLSDLTRLSLLIVCPPTLRELHTEIRQRWSSVHRSSGRLSKPAGSEDVQRPADHFEDDGLWRPYRGDAEAWFAGHEHEIEKVFSDWSRTNKPPDHDSDFDGIVSSLCAIEGRPESPRPGA